MTDYKSLIEELKYGAEYGCDYDLIERAAAAIAELMVYDIRQLPEGLYGLKNGVVFTARMKLSGGNVYNVKTGESHWEDDRIIGGEQVLPKPEAEKQGEWIRVQKVDIPGEIHPAAFKCMCSVCRNEYIFPRIPQYCPDCGSMNTAKMEVQDA